jgi:DNA polymerase-3 subunit epsilon
MKKFFIDKIFNPDQSVTIKEFKELPKDLFTKDIVKTDDMGFCVILDTETTGLEFEKDEIIEIAIRKWIYHKKDHYLIKPVEEYSQLNAPVNNQITPAITEITGITKEDVVGKKINWSIVARLIRDSDFVLAHNSGFDRTIIESVPEINEVSASKIWVCSLVQVDWEEKGFLSSKQELLSLFHGFHYAGHRALTDIDALANILLQGDYLKEILQNAKIKQVRVDCIRAPFESKDILKSNGFSWDSLNKFWTKLFPETDLESIKTFLENKVYTNGKMEADFKFINIRDRFKK